MKAIGDTRINRTSILSKERNHFFVQAWQHKLNIHVDIGSGWVGLGEEKLTRLLRWAIVNEWR